MAKTTGPLLSLRARGTIAKTATFSDWRGVSYVRQRVIPANPDTDEQKKTRQPFTWLSAAWKMLPTIGITPFLAASLGKPLTDRNVYIKSNLPTLREETDLLKIIGSPGALGGLPPATVDAVGGVTILTVTVTVGTPPTGWTTTKVQCVIYKDQDPHLAFASVIDAKEDATSPYVLEFTGLAAGVWVASAWVVYLRADERTAYGPSVNDSDTVTAA